MTRDLLALRDWLTAAGCTHVAMESTSSYSRPIYNLLEGQFVVWVANAFQIKQVPGHKTDVRDAEWIAELLRHGLLKPSFVPDRAQRELRELTRYRTALVGERAAEAARLQKVLEGANLKLGDVASNVLGVSARAMLERLRAHQRFLLAQQLVHLDFLDEAIGQASAEIAARLRPLEAAIVPLCVNLR